MQMSVCLTGPGQEEAGSGLKESLFNNVSVSWARALASAGSQAQPSQGPAWRAEPVVALLPLLPFILLLIQGPL